MVLLDPLFTKNLTLPSPSVLLDFDHDRNEGLFGSLTFDICHTLQNRPSVPLSTRNISFFYATLCRFHTHAETHGPYDTWSQTIARSYKQGLGVLGLKVAQWSAAEGRALHLFRWRQNVAMGRSDCVLLKAALFGFYRANRGSTKIQHR